jgi:S1-C subfamily serine protease
LLPPFSGAIGWGLTGTTVTRFISLFSLSLLLAACASGTNPVDLESRAIAVEQGVEPTAGASSAAVTHLLPAAGPTYVTLNVTAVNRFESGDKARKSAITSGSGYLVESHGIVMTAAHVAVQKGNEIAARAANGRIYTGNVIAINPTNDMAIIKLRGYSGRSAMPAAPGCVARNDLVFTLGRPHAQGDTARVGRLEARHFGRAVAYGKFGYPDALVLRMGTQKGESGGPLFDGKGQLIGMVVSTLTDANGNLINLAHAIPSTALANFLCSETQCSAPWAALARASVDQCGGA